jgi:hypothetical protein
VLYHCVAVTETLMVVPQLAGVMPLGPTITFAGGDVLLSLKSAVSPDSGE